jgi:2-oxoacid:acceptor oxidoreductase gamma subunit (pyruvate/2-ketoisovalerate family)
MIAPARAAAIAIRVHGRGGQGAQAACQMLASAFHRAGRVAQAFAAYGGERRGAPVTGFVRAADEPIHLRCDIERADVALVLDPTLLPALDPSTLAGDAVVVVNARSAPDAPGLGPRRVVTVDATAIAGRHSLGPIVATAMLGALGGVLRCVGREEMLAAVEALSPAKPAENVAACADAWGAAGELAEGPVVAGPSSREASREASRTAPRPVASRPGASRPRRSRSVRSAGPSRAAPRSSSTPAAGAPGGRSGSKRPRRAGRRARRARRFQDGSGGRARAISPARGR